MVVPVHTHTSLSSDAFFLFGLVWECNVGHSAEHSSLLSLNPARPCPLHAKFIPATTGTSTGGRGTGGWRCPKSLCITWDVVLLFDRRRTDKFIENFRRILWVEGSKVKAPSMDR
jgi:hypothetical protein